MKEVKIECIDDSQITGFMEKDDSTEGLKIQNLSFKNLMKEKNTLIILINMTNSHMILKKYIKKLMRYRKILCKKFDTITFYLLSYQRSEMIQKQFKELLIPICSSNKKEIYSKAYDLACDYLDSFFYGKNLCDFHHNKCGYKKDCNLEIGCCRHFEKHKQFGLLWGEKLVPCEKLGPDGHCSIKCLCCKLMTCEYLNKKGIRFKQKEIFPIDCIFNYKQRIYIKCIAYTPKEEIMKRIMLLSF